MLLPSGGMPPEFASLKLEVEEAETPQLSPFRFWFDLRTSLLGGLREERQSRGENKSTKSLLF